MFRKTRTNLRKLKDVADDLEAVVMRPFYRASDLYRVVRDRDALQLDFMARIDGIRSFERLRDSASPIQFGGHELLVASLVDVIRSKKAAGRPQDLAVLPCFNARSMPKKRPKSPKRSALARESERVQLEQIRRLLALPPSQRTNFLRKRIPFRGSSI